MGRGLPPDGYRWTGKGMEIELIDPDWCPAGHPADLVKRGIHRCAVHGYAIHHEWTCSCGQLIWRVEGQFVGEQCR